MKKTVFIVFLGIVLLWGLYLTNRHELRFDVNTALNKVPPGIVNTFTLIDTPAESQAPELLLHKLNLPLKEETDIFTLYQNQQASLKISNNNNYYIYTNLAPDANIQTVSQEEALNILLAWFAEMEITLDYQYTLVTFDRQKEIYTIRFINTLQGLDNLAYPKTATVSQNGCVLFWEWNQFQYKKTGAAKTISQQAAYEKMTLLLEKNTSGAIDLSGCKLVYYQFDDEIIPSYYFTGEMNGNGFEYILPALEYY